jgi:hypothetical protein
MLGWLRLQGKLTDRKARLFGVACCRHLWHLLTDERSRQAVEVAEDYADERLGKVELAASRAAAKGARRALKRMSNGSAQAARAAAEATAPSAKIAALNAAQAVISCTWQLARATESPTLDGMNQRDRVNAYVSSLAPKVTATDGERCFQADLLRDIFGPLAFRPITVASSWRTPTIVELATTMYDQRSFDQLPEVAALLDAVGCTDAQILGHLRGPGPHVRGCFALDPIVGME